MKTKLTALAFIVLLLFSAYLVVTPAKADETMKIYIDPPQIIDQTLTPDKTFVIDVKMENAPATPGVCGVEFKLTWDPSILNAVSMEEVLFHSVTPESELDNLWKLKHEVKTDYVWYAYAFLDIDRAISGGYAPISGNHTIARITMNVKAIGSTTIKIADSKVGDPSGEPVNHQRFDGYFRNSPPPPPAQLYVDPPKISDLNLTPCKNFTVDIKISNASELCGLEFKLGFDPNILHATTIECGEFVPTTPTTMIDNTAGYAKFNFSAETPLSGNGTVASITFHVENLGKSPLDLYDTELVDITGQPLAHQAYGGSFNNILLAKLAVQPEEIIDPTLLPPSTFTINVTIAEVEDLYGYDFKLVYDPAILVCIQVNIQDILNETNYIPNYSIDNINGSVTVNVTYYLPAVPITLSPPTAIMTIKFRVRGIGASNLTLTETKLVNSIGQLITHEVYNGFFQSLIRDIAVIAVFSDPSTIYEGQKTNITVIVKNEGNITETFSVKLYYDGTLFATIDVVNLAPNENATATTTWNTIGVTPGNYSIKAEVPPVPYEIETTDNILTDGFVNIKIMGDVNGDDVVDMYDVLLASKAFGSRPADINWNPDCDLNRDNVIDIFDLLKLAANFGRKI
jgi:hypothetical protein